MQENTYNNRYLVKTIDYSAPAGIATTPGVTFSYDDAGSRISMSDGLGSVGYNYNQLSQVTAETRTLNGLGTYTVSYDYNLAGQLKKITDPTEMTKQIPERLLYEGEITITLLKNLRAILRERVSLKDFLSSSWSEFPDI